jgi:hypothetical protein
LLKFKSVLNVNTNMKMYCLMNSVIFECWEMMLKRRLGVRPK